MPALARGDRNGQHAGNAAQRAIESQFTHQQELAEIFQLQRTVGAENADGHRQVKTRSFFLEIGWSQIDRNLRRRNIEAGVLDGGADPVAAFTHRSVRQAYGVKPVFHRPDAGVVDFHIDDVSVDAVNRRTECLEEHGGSS